MPYQPGEIKVVAYTEGTVKCEKVIKTAGQAKNIKMTADRSAITADGKDLSFITVTVHDAEGNPCSLADNPIHFTVDGPASIAAVGNGNSASLEPFKSDNISLFNGKCLLIIKSDKKAGNIKITASSNGLTESTISITTE